MIASRLVRWRVGVQAAFLLVWLDPLMLRLHSVCAPVFHCYSCPLATFACPIGVIANFSALHLVPFVAIGTLVIVGGITGSFLCGWACPFGLVQDLAGRVPVRKFELPAWTGHFRYVVLVALVLAVPYFFGEGHPLFICRLCPVGGLEGAIPNSVKLAVAGEDVIWPNALKIGIIGLVVGAMFFKWRPWCSVLCPLGGILGLFNRSSAFFLRYNRDRCTGCGSCDTLCRYGVRPEKRANDSRCVRCLECTRCPALDVSSVLSRPAASHPGAERTR